jgi:hypothetical protein
MVFSLAFPILFSNRPVFCRASRPAAPGNSEQPKSAKAYFGVTALAFSLTRALILLYRLA